MAAKNVPVICYDLPTVSKFFRSVALAVAFQKHVKLEWETYKDSRVLNAVYTVLFWKEAPGTVEVKMGSRQAIEESTDELHDRYLMAWIKKVYESGPAAGNQYVAQMLQLREVAREAVQSTFRDAALINSEIARQTGEAIVQLARIKLAAQVGVAILGAGVSIAFVSAAAAGGAAGGGLTILGVQAGAGAGTFGLTGLGASVTNSLIKSWEGGPGAKVAAVSTDVGKFVASEAGGHATGHVVEKALVQQGRAQQILQSAQGEIRKFSQKLEQEVLKKAARNKATNIVARAQGQVVTQTANLARSGNMLRGAALAGKSIPVFFAAWDIMDAWGDYGDTVGAVR